jgi:hypothetical protein
MAIPAPVRSLLCAGICVAVLIASHGCSRSPHEGDHAPVVGAKGSRESDDDDGYVGMRLKRQFNETPRMGWFLPGAGFVAPEQHDAVTVITDSGSPSRLAYAALVTPSQRKAMKEQFLACETFAKDPLFLFTGASSRGDFPRALFVTQSLPATVRGGLESASLAADDLAAVDRALGWDRVAGPRWDRAFTLPGSPFSYSIHRRYDGASKELRREALVLHGADHRIVAFDRHDDLEKELCDGCGLPSLADDLGFLFRPLNLFQFPEFPYPLMLFDTSTIEGRALSLTTFTPEGRVSSFRRYEYAFTCGVDDGGVQ